MREIVVAVDGSDGAAGAIRFAARLASDTGAHLTAVHIHHLPGWSYEYFDLQTINAYFANADAEIRRRTEDAVRGSAAPFDFVSDEGDTAEMIGSIAEKMGADVIVVGSHGRHALGRFLLGSVSTKVVHDATRPVVVVPPERPSGQPQAR